MEVEVFTAVEVSTVADWGAVADTVWAAVADRASVLEDHTGEEDLVVAPD